MKTGLPRNLTEIWVPDLDADTSTRIEDSACTSAEGFIWLISGQTAAPVVDDRRAAGGIEQEVAACAFVIVCVGHDFLHLEAGWAGPK
jgi:hypothetical protein